MIGQQKWQRRSGVLVLGNLCLVWGTLAVAQTPPAPVVVSPVVEDEIEIRETFVATVKPVKTATVGSAVAGRVIDLQVEEGDYIESGGVLAQLLTATIELEHAAAQAELELKQFERDELENGTRPEELAQAQAAVLRAEALYKYMENRRERAQALFSNGQATSKEELDESISAAEAANQNLSAARAALALAEAGPRQEKIDQAKAQVRIQQAIVDRLADQIAKYTVRARFSGYVVRKHTEVGAWVQSGDPVVDMVALEPVEVESFVLEKQVPFVRLGGHVPVVVPALGDREFSGEVAAVVPQADVRARTFPVKVRVPNQVTDNGPLLKAGMFARVKLPTGPKQLALLVAKDGLVFGGATPIVYVVRPATQEGELPQVAPVPVRVGDAWGDFMQVTAVDGSLRPGQEVVIEGNERLRPMQSVTVTRVQEFPVPSTIATEASLATP